jgi:glycosyltransferase involved in cell wall biosynthesis
MANATLETKSPRTTSPERDARPVVCHVVHSLNLGGAEVLATRMAARLANDFRPVVACLDDAGVLADRLSEQNIPWIHLKRGGGLDWKCVRRLSAWLREHRVDLVHAHQYTPFAYTLLCGVAGQRPPVLFTEHGRFYPDRVSWKRRWLNRLLMKRSDRLIGVGRAVRRALIEVEGLPAAQTDVIYNGVPRTIADPTARCRLRGECGATDSTFVIVHVARLDPIKHHRLALVAMQKLIQSHTDAQLWMVGAGPERASLEAVRQELQLESHVKLLGERRDVPNLLSAADAAILTSHSEGIPLVLIEAMAAGLPIVATDVGGVSEIVIDGEQGSLVASNDAESLAAELQALACNSSLRERLGSAGRQRAELFTEDRMIESYHRLYRSMVRT